MNNTSKYLYSLLGAIVLLCASAFTTLAQPANDNCANASAINITNGGYDLGVFNSTTYTITSATNEFGEYFPTGNPNAKSMWYTFTIPTTREVKITLKQPSGGTMLTTDAGWTLYKTTTCLPGAAEQQNPPIARIEGFTHDCLRKGTYYLQVGAATAAAGDLFFELDISHSTNGDADHDNPASAYDFGVLSGPTTVSHTYDVGCQGIFFNEPACGGSTNDFVKSSWHIFTTDAVPDLVHMMLDETNNGGGTAAEFHVQLFEGDARTTDSTSMPLVAGCDTLGDRGRLFWPCLLKPNTTYSIQISYHTDYFGDVRLEMNEVGNNQTIGWDYSALPASHSLGNISTNSTQQIQDYFSCNANVSNNCSPLDTAVGFRDVNWWVTFTIGSDATANYRLWQINGMSPNPLVRLFKGDVASDPCNSLELISEHTTHSSTYTNTGCLEPGDYSFQVLGHIDPQVKTHFSTYNTGADKLCSLEIDLDSVITNQYSLTPVTDIDQINGGAALADGVTYYADSNMVDCNTTILPGGDSCGHDRAMYRRINIGNDGILTLGGGRWTNYNYRFFRGDAAALPVVNDTIDGLEEILCCNDLRYTHDICVTPGIYTLVTYGDENDAGVWDYPWMEWNDIDNRFHDPAMPYVFTDQLTDTFNTIIAEGVNFDCDTNPMTILGETPCFSSDKQIYREFYVADYVSIDFRYWTFWSPTWPTRGRTIYHRIYQGRISHDHDGNPATTDGITALALDCFTTRDMPQCDLIEPGWYTIVSYTTGHNYWNPERCTPTSFWQGSGEGDIDSFNMTANAPPLDPVFNTFASEEDTVGTNAFHGIPGQTDWFQHTGHTAATPFTETIYNLGREYYNCFPDTAFPPGITPCIADSTGLHPDRYSNGSDSSNRLTFRKFTITQPSYVYIDDLDNGCGYYNSTSRLYAGDITATSPPYTVIHECIYDEMEICELAAGTYTLVTFASENCEGRYSDPYLMVDVVGTSKYDHAGDAYDFGTVPGDSVTYQAKVGDPLDINGLPASCDAFYCSTTAQSTDPGVGCGLGEGPPANDLPEETDPKQNLWYTFQVYGGGDITVKIEGVSQSKNTVPAYRIYRIDSNRNFPMRPNALPLSDTIKDATDTLWTLVEDNAVPCFGCCRTQTVNWTHEKCPADTTRFVIVVDRWARYGSDAYYRGVQQIKVDITYDFDPPTIHRDTFDQQLCFWDSFTVSTYDAFPLWPYTRNIVAGQNVYVGNDSLVYTLGAPFNHSVYIDTAETPDRKYYKIDANATTALIIDTTIEALDNCPRYNYHEVSIVPSPPYNKIGSANYINGLGQCAGPYTEDTLSGAGASGLTLQGCKTDMTCANIDNTDPYPTGVWPNDCGAGRNKNVWYKFHVKNSGRMYIQYDYVRDTDGNTFTTWNNNGIRLYKATNPGGDSTNFGLVQQPMVSEWLTTHPTLPSSLWGEGCYSEGTYYLMITGCVFGNENDSVCPRIYMTEYDGDYCRNAIDVNVPTAGTFTSSALVDCWSIGEAPGEDGTNMGCLGGPSGYKTGWYHIKMPSGQTWDLDVKVNNLTTAGPTEIQWRVGTGLCNSMTYGNCVTDAFITLNLKCRRDSNLYIQVSLPDNETGDLELEVTATLSPDQSCAYCPLCPLANFDFPPACEFDTICFTNNSTAGPDVTYLWDYGNGDTDTAFVPCYQYNNVLGDSSNGTFPVQLIVTNAHGADTSLRLMTIPKRPYTYFSTDSIDDPTIAGAPITLYDSTANADPLATYRWDFCNGNYTGCEASIDTFIGKNPPPFTFYKTGSYPVCLTVTNPICDSTYCDTINIFELNFFKGGAYDGFDVDKDTCPVIKFFAGGPYDGYDHRHLAMPNYDSCVITLCLGDSVMIDSVMVGSAGMYTDTFITSTSNCDSIVVYKVCVLPLAYKQDTIKTVICQGSSVQVGNRTITSGGVYTDTVLSTVDTVCSKLLNPTSTACPTISSCGCDSLQYVLVEECTQVTLTRAVTICDGDSICLAGGQQRTTGLYIDTMFVLAPGDTVILDTTGVCDTIMGYPTVNKSPLGGACLDGSGTAIGPMTTVNMSTGTTTTCNAKFYDSGGPTADYANSENFTHTFCPSDPSKKIKFHFNQFNLEGCCDFFRVYDGNSTSAPLIGSFNGTTNPPAITSTSPDGCLTVHFTSDGSVFRDGWEITVVCADDVPPPPPPTDSIVMSAGNVTMSSCYVSFYDPAGSTGNYLNGQNVTQTIFPPASGQSVVIDFNSFGFECCCDFLRIYDGNSTSAPLLGSFNCTSLPPSFTSTAADGSLTFHFTSDGSVTNIGWDATLSCDPAEEASCGNAADSCYKCPIVLRTNLTVQPKDTIPIVTTICTDITDTVFVYGANDTIMFFAPTVGDSIVELLDTATNCPRCYRVTISPTTCTPLPVEFLNFDGRLIEDYVELTWTTVVEIDNDYFDVQRSLDGIEFTDIDQVDAAGNTTEMQHYISYDYDPQPGLNYYRLKQFDFDGTFEYSNTIVVFVDLGDQGQIAVLPNPTRGMVYISGSIVDEPKLTIEVTNAIGEIVMVRTYDNPEELNTSIDLSKFAEGMYFINFKGEHLKESKKVILTK